MKIGNLHNNITYFFKVYKPRTHTLAHTCTSITHK